MLGIMYGCEIFHDYIYGRDKVLIETDHKPLESIAKKNLNDVPQRLQRMLLRIQRYNTIIQYKPGKELFITDTLSCAARKCASEPEIPISVIEQVPSSMTD